MANLDAVFMELALGEAKQALAEGAIPVGCVLVCNGKVIGRGRKIKDDRLFGHAEMIALRSGLNDHRYSRSDDVCVYTTLEPCTMCMGTIMHCPIARLVIALEDPYGGATQTFSSEFPYRHRGKVPSISRGVGREQSRILLENYLALDDVPEWMLDEQNLLIKLIRKKDWETPIPGRD